MSYQPYNRNAKSLVYFGDAGADALFQSDSDLKFDDSSNKLIIPTSGYIGSVGQDDAIRIDHDGNLTTIAAVTVGGDLIVNGTTTTVNSTTVTIDDPIFTLGGDTAPGSDDNKDRGIEFRYHNGSTAKLGFFGFDDSTGKFKFIPDATNSSEVFSGSAGTIEANLEGNVTGNVTGDVTGNADTATALETARNFSLTGEVTASAVSFDGQGNVQLSAVLDNTAITGQSAKTSAASTDLLLIADSADSNNLKKITKAQFISDLGGGTMSNFTLAGDSGSSQTIEDSNTMTLTGGSQAMITVAAGATDTATFSIASAIAGTGVEFDSSQGISVTAGTGIAVDGNGVHASLNSYTVQSTAANSITTTASRTYSVQVDSSDNLVVNVPWTDVNELTTEEVQDIVGAQIVTNGSHTLLSATYDDGTDGGINLTVDNDLSNYSNASSNFFDTAGAGLTSTGSTVNVVGGDGITANADEIEVTVDGSTIELSASNGTGAVRVKALGIDTAQLAADAVDGTKIADDAVNSEHIAAGAVDLEHMSANSVDSDQYVDGSIDAAHIASSAVTEVKRLRTVGTASSTSTISNDITLGTSGASGITLTLPSAVSGKVVIVKKVDSGVGALTISGPTNGIDGATTKALYHQYETMTLVSNGSVWYIV